MTNGDNSISQDAGAIRRAPVSSWKFDTIAVHGLYSLEEAARHCGPVIEPIVGSTAQAFGSADALEAALAYRVPAWAYSRIHNPTIGYLEDTLALLETYKSGITASALSTASGMSAIVQALEPLVALSSANEVVNFVSSAQVYGGTFQLMSARMPERGAFPRWVTVPEDIDRWAELIDDATRFLYLEAPSNPQLGFADIGLLADLAHAYGIPLIVDSTLATPALMRPLAHGADIVVHSLTKTIGASGTAIGGAMIARHDIVSDRLHADQRKNFAMWSKLYPFRDKGPCMAPQTAFAFLSELRTLRTRVAHLSSSTEKVVRFLDEDPRVASVSYLGLPSHPLHEMASVYMRLADTSRSMYGHLLCFEPKGDIAVCRTFFDRLRLIARATDLGRIKSIATIPAISTHQQQGDVGRNLAGISPTMVRLSVGGEDPDDIIADLDQALG